MKKTTKSSIQDSRGYGWDSNSISAEHKSEVTSQMLTKSSTSCGYLLSLGYQLLFCVIFMLHIFAYEHLKPAPLEAICI